MNDTPTFSSRTFGNEDTLPRVPLPTPEESCERFLEWSAPLLTAAEREATEAAVREFLEPGSPAHTLHAALAEYDATPGVASWLDEFWPSRYLGRRDRIALNANFFFLFADAELEQVPRAAALVRSAVDHKLRLDREELPPVVQRGQPQSMDQHRFLFSTTRIPGWEQDTVRAPYSERQPGPSPARHIVVFFRGNTFRMDVLDPEGRPYAPADLEAGLHEVTKAGVVPAQYSVGSLTTEARAEWADDRRELAALPGNAEALETVETALLCLCLDDLVPGDAQQACDQLLHGDSGNRWFDKSVSLVVFGDGRAGINVEHCGLDGTTVLAFVDDLLDGDPEPVEPRGTPAVDFVEFTLDEALRTKVRTAATAFADYAAANATTTVAFDDFGSAEAKRLGVSPDAFVQMAYQMAHKRTKGFTGATYESIATRQYRNGRTEAMRVITPEILRFVAVMDDPDADADTRREAFRAAADKHVARAKECQTGRAPEQHLWELQLIQQRRGAELGATGELALYDTPGWRIMRDDYLSTSSAPSKNIRFFGFGSTSSHCIGVAYVLLPDRFHLYLSTPQAVAEQMYSFAEHLRTAVYELRDLLDTGN